MGWIGSLPPRKRFAPSDIYRFLASNHLEKTKARGDADKEPRFQNDARWAIKDAHLDGLIVHLTRGVWERTAKPLDPKPVALGADDLDV